MNEELLLRYLRGLVSAVGTILAYFLGGWDGTVIALATFVVIDYITGLIAAFINQEVSSEVGWIGILRKVGIFTAVSIAHLVDGAINIDQPILRTVTIMFYISNESLSALENLAEAGVDIPPFLKKALIQLKKDSSKST
ncbi:phage holin family protein [Halonatronum saccharophilum]|uniref:phage holin family protein n=1 Tax=Halonatronum saccharophilum TaxID=150060 RepID=UPI0004834920|nr:phage holin family protein [Halonatronum saccharophilum]